MNRVPRVVYIIFLAFFKILIIPTHGRYLQTSPLKNGTELETRVYRKPTNTGLLLHFKAMLTNATKPVY